MPTSRTGKFSHGGFTLFELVIVIFIISMTTALIMPSLWDTGERALESEARRIANTLRYIYDEAAGKKQTYTLTFNIDDSSWEYKAENEVRSFNLKEHIMFRDITVPSLGPVNEGEMVMEIGPLGPAEPLTVHLIREEYEYTVTFNHISGRAKVYEGYKVLSEEE